MGEQIRSRLFEPFLDLLLHLVMGVDPASLNVRKPPLVEFDETRGAKLNRAIYMMTTVGSSNSHRDDLSTAGAILEQREYEYDELGRLASERLFSRSDEEGRIVEKTSSVDGELSTKFVYEYDQEGNLRRVEQRSPDDSPTHESVYDYSCRP